jgi:hypothetical protein
MRTCGCGSRQFKVSATWYGEMCIELTEEGGFEGSSPILVTANSSVVRLLNVWNAGEAFRFVNGTSQGLPSKAAHNKYEEETICS